MLKEKSFEFPQLFIHHVCICYTLQGLSKCNGGKSLIITIVMQITAEARDLAQFPLPVLQEMFTYRKHASQAHKFVDSLLLLPKTRLNCRTCFNIFRNTNNIQRFETLPYSCTVGVSYQENQEKQLDKEGFSAEYPNM